MLITCYAHNDQHLPQVKTRVTNNVVVGSLVFNRIIAQPLWARHCAIRNRGEVVNETLLVLRVCPWWGGRETSKGHEAVCEDLSRGKYSVGPRPRRGASLPGKQDKKVY